MALILLGGVCAIAAASYAGFVWYVANVEQPDYRSIKRAGAFELRDSQAEFRETLELP